MHSKITLDQISEEIKSGKASELNILIKGDVDGSIEALSDSLMNLSNSEVRVNIILKSVGMVSQTDIRLASASKAIVVANVNKFQENFKNLVLISSIILLFMKQLKKSV